METVEVAKLIISAINDPSYLGLTGRYNGTAADPTKIIKKLQGKTVINRADLTEISIVKNGKKIAGNKRDAVQSNSAMALQALTSAALTTEDSEIAIRLLLGLSGVKIPTASCILSWTHPDKWPVIDVRACKAINKISQKPILPEKSSSLKVSHWLTYVKIVRAVSAETNKTPQEVDRWLYCYYKFTA